MFITAHFKIRMKTNLFALLLIVSLTNAFAQNTGTILGSVRDKRTQETLIGVTVPVSYTHLDVYKRQRQRNSG